MAGNDNGAARLQMDSLVQHMAQQGPVRPDAGAPWECGFSCACLCRLTAMMRMSSGVMAICVRPAQDHPRREKPDYPPLHCGNGMCATGNARRSVHRANP